MKKITGKEFISKNRIFIGIFCVVVALVTGLFILPVETANNNKTYDVLVLNNDIVAGSVLSTSDFTLGTTNDKAIADNTLYKNDDVVGKTATRDLFLGAYIYKSDISDNTTAATVPAGKQIIAVSVSSLATDVAYQLKSGDVVRAFSISDTGIDIGMAVTPNELQYIQVYAVYDVNGINTNGKEGSIPKAISFVVNQQQAKKLVELENAGYLHFSLMSTGSSKTAETLLDYQENIFAIQEDLSK